MSPECFGFIYDDGNVFRVYGKGRKKQHCFVFCLPLSRESPFVSMNFAVASSKHMKVLLIDANLITPTLHDPMGYNPIPGLSDLIIGKNTIEEAIVSVKDGSLAFLPAGTYPANENLLLQNPRFYDLMEQY